MAGQSWLAWAFAGVMIVAAYCLTRLLASWRQHRPTDHRVDGKHVLMGVAMAGMLVPRLRVFWTGGWEVVFAVGAAWFGWLALREFRGQPTTGGRPGHHLQRLLACGAMLYMYLAVATVAKAAAGGSAMGGMAAGGAHFRTLALVLAFALFGYVVWNVGPALVAGAGRGPRGPQRAGSGPRRGGRGRRSQPRRRGRRRQPSRTRAAKARAAPRVMTARRRRAGRAVAAVPSLGRVLRDCHGRDDGIHAHSAALTSASNSLIPMLEAGVPGVPWQA